MRLEHSDASPTYVYLLTHKASASFSEVFNGDPETFYGTMNLVNLMIKPLNLFKKSNLQVFHMLMKSCTSFLLEKNYFQMQYPRKKMKTCVRHLCSCGLTSLGLGKSFSLK